MYVFKLKNTDFSVKRGIRFFCSVSMATFVYIICILVFFLQVVVFDRAWIFSFKSFLPVYELA